ncbi:MAG: ion transporter [Lachnospiraceae bacterium]|nr:ion transporter [Lachnospiraceae bacterium]
MKQVRQNIWDMFDGKSKVGSFYDVIMMVVIVVSLVPLVFKQENTVLLWLDHITVTIFIIDYILRWFTADLRLKRGTKSFALYPVTPWAILDLVCILPSFQVIAGAFRILKVARLFRTLRVFRSIKLLRNSKSIKIIWNVIRDQWRALMTVLAIAVGYVLVVALVMFNIEPDTFDHFFHAVYWATVTLTTIGYGDVYPLSTLGQAFTIISAFVGVAVIALPSGIIAGGFIDEVNKVQEDTGEEVTSAPEQDNPLVQIEKLSDLKDKGIVTEEEFISKKAELLTRI